MSAWCWYPSVCKAWGAQHLNRLGLFAVLFGLAAMASYWLYAATAEQPLFSLALFRTSTFAIGIWGNLFARLGSGAMPFLTRCFPATGARLLPSKAGMTMIPTVIGAMLTKTLVNKLIPRIGYRRILIGNTLALGAAIASFYFIDNQVPPRRNAGVAGGLWRHQLPAISPP